jgi:transcriptional regulator with XRE-family HTH domain
MQAGMSQGEVAAKMGVAQSYVSRAEAGEENVTIATCERFARALGRVYSSELVLSSARIPVKHHGIGNVTLSTCERFAHAVGGTYVSDFHEHFTA